MENKQMNNNYKQIVKGNNKIEMYRVIVRLHCFLYKIKLSITQETILCYLCVHGISEHSYKLIYQDKIIGSMDCLYNAVSALIKKKLIDKKGRDYKAIIKDLQIDIISNKSTLLSVRLDYINNE